MCVLPIPPLPKLWMFSHLHRRHVFKEVLAPTLLPCKVIPKFIPNRNVYIWPPKNRKKNGNGPPLETNQTPFSNRMDKLWYIHTTEDYSAARMSNIDKSYRCNWNERSYFQKNNVPF